MDIEKYFFSIVLSSTYVGTGRLPLTKKDKSLRTTLPIKASIIFLEVSYLIFLRVVSYVISNNKTEETYEQHTQRSLTACEE